MPIDLVCPSCEKKLRVADRHAGKQTRCPACEWKIRIPELEVVDAIVDAVEDLEPVEDDASGVTDHQEQEKECPVCCEVILKTAVRCRYCKATLDPDGNALWRKGKIMIMNRNLQLPDSCIKTGDHAEVRKKVDLSWMPPGKQIFMLLLVGALLAQLWSVKATVYIPLSKEWARRRVRRLVIGTVMLLGGVAAMIGGIVAELDESILAPLVIGSLLMMLIGIVVVVMAGNIVTPTKITDSHIWLKGAKPPFLDTLPEWHGMG